MSSAFSPAFLDGEGRALRFLEDAFRKPAARAAAVARASTRKVSPEVLATLRAQAGDAGFGAQSEPSLERLARPGATVVVTGQQVGLFLGPLYSLYKAAACIVTARALEAQTGQPCVPVFWLQSEDHDFEEVQGCDVLSAAGAVEHLAVEGPQGRCSLAQRLLGQDVLRALDTLDQALEGLPHTGEVRALLRAHYRPERGWVQAFAGVLRALFAAEGLLCLDPRDARLAPTLARLHLRAFEGHDALVQGLAAREEALRAAGFEVQVPLRPSSSLSFVHPDGAAGPRFRLEREGRDWKHEGRLVVPERVSPDCFSSSALLRPALQDSLLPTAAVVLGPGELNYFAQLAPVYAAFELPVPMVVPRARFRVVDARSRARLSKLGLSAAELEAPRQALLARLAPSPQAADLERRLVEALEPILAEVKSDEPSVAKGLQRTRGTIARAASRLCARIARAQQQQDAALVARVDALQAALAPGGAPQERVLSFPSMAARYGVQAFTQRVLAHVVPFEPRVQELTP